MLYYYCRYGRLEVNEAVKVLLRRSCSKKVATRNSYETSSAFLWDSSPSTRVQAYLCMVAPVANPRRIDCPAQFLPIIDGIKGESVHVREQAKHHFGTLID